MPPQVQAQAPALDPNGTLVEDAGQANAGTYQVAQQLHDNDNVPQQDPKQLKRINQYLDLAKAALGREDFGVAEEALRRIACEVNPELRPIVQPNPDGTIPEEPRLKLRDSPVQYESAEAAAEAKWKVVDRALALAMEAAVANRLDLALQALEVGEASAAGTGEMSALHSLENMPPQELKRAIMNRALAILEASRGDYDRTGQVLGVLSVLQPDNPEMAALIKEIKSTINPVHDLAEIQSDLRAEGPELDRLAKLTQDASNRLVDIPHDLAPINEELKHIDELKVLKRQEIEGLEEKKAGIAEIILKIQADIAVCTRELNALGAVAEARTQDAKEKSALKDEAEQKLAEAEKELKKLKKLKSEDAIKEQTKKIEELKNEIASYNEAIAEAEKVVRHYKAKGAELELLEQKMTEAQEPLGPLASQIEKAREEYDQIEPRRKELLEKRRQLQQEEIRVKQEEGVYHQAHSEAKKIWSEIEAAFQEVQLEVAPRVEELRTRIAEYLSR